MGKRKEICKIKTREQTEQLIELVRQNTALYDPTSRCHKDAIMLANIWKTIAREMKVT